MGMSTATFREQANDIPVQGAVDVLVPTTSIEKRSPSVNGGFMTPHVAGNRSTSTKEGVRETVEPMLTTAGGVAVVAADPLLLPVAVPPPHAAAQKGTAITMIAFTSRPVDMVKLQPARRGRQDRVYLRVGSTAEPAQAEPHAG